MAEDVKVAQNKRTKKVIDPTKPLKEPNHEKMAILRAKGLSKTQAYLETYPNVKYDSARALAPNIVNKQGIDDRALHLLAQAGLSEEKLARSLNDCVDEVDDKRIKLDATKFGLSMIGYGRNDQKVDNKSYSPTMINIIIRSKSNDDKDIQTNTVIDTTLT